MSGSTHPGDAVSYAERVARHVPGLYDMHRMTWYQGVFEPVAILGWAKVAHPAVEASLRNYDTALARLDEVLVKQPYLLGQDYSAADLLCAAPFAWFGDALPATPAVKAWVARCMDRPAVRQTGER